MIDQFTNSASSRPGGNAGGPGEALAGLFSNPGGLAAAGAAGGLAGLLLGGGKPKKLAKNAVKFGGVALVGGLAYKAWRDWQTKNAAHGAGAPAPQNLRQPAQRGAQSLFIPESREQQANLARILARAMIAATKADGTVTAREKARIVDRLTDLGVSQHDIGFIEAEIDEPLNIEAVVADARSPELAIEIYTASLLAIDPEGAAERGYLAMLASRLELERTLIDEIHANVATPIGDTAA